MLLTILGSGSCVPSLKRGASGILLEAGGKKLLLDMGLGAIHKLLQKGTGYLDIDAIGFTHVHPDHVSELIPFLFACKYAEITREKDLTIIGGEGFGDFYESLSRTFHGWLEPENFHLELKELIGGPYFLDDVEILTSGVKHSPESIAYRITHNGKTFVFSGDTGYCTGIVELSKGANLLVLECSTPNLCKPDTHLNPSLAGRIASESGCRRLVLTHFYPACDKFDIVSECRETYDGELILAQDLMEIEA